MRFKRSTFVPHPPGVSKVTLVDWKFEEGDYGPQYRLSFDSEMVMEETEQPYRVNAWIGVSLNPKSNAFKYLKALGFDVESEAAEEAEIEEILDDLIARGATCTAWIEEAPRKDGTTGTKITNMLAITKPGRRPSTYSEASGAAPATRTFGKPTSGGKPASGGRTTPPQPAVAAADPDPFQNE